jgi:amino acid adenylation domain-containing protein
VTALLHEAVSERAAEAAGRTAVVLGDEQLTYAELDSGANRIANALRGLGCGRGDRVCLFVPKSGRAVTAMLGSLKAGCLYVPIDLSSPPPRLAKIVRAADPAAVAVTAAAVPLLDGVLDVLGGSGHVRFLGLDDVDAGRRFAVDARADDVAEADATPPRLPISADDGAHILFTSGSTGTPKGVVISHRNVLSFLGWAIPYFGIGAGDRVSGHAPFHFDLSTFDVYGALVSGAELHLVPPELSLMPRDVAALIDRARLTQWFSVPSVLTYMANFDAVPAGGFPSLRRVIWCGDVLPTPILSHWMNRVPHAQYTNLYGPTETTIASSYHTVTTPPADETTPIPIGRACAGEELLVLDAGLRPVPVGTTGDLYIGGAGLSAGYWRDEPKTAAAFVPDPRGPAGRRLYRTGDLARVDADGLVHFLGREDSQVKSRGHRIELGEVEAAASAVDGVRQTAVVGVAAEGFEGTAICCAFVADDEAVTTPAELRKALRAVLPPYMIPTRWLTLPSLPTNANGKIDRPQLRRLFADAEAREEQPSREVAS